VERFVTITGLSGSGKSLAMRSLEDLDFYCVDNLPVALILPFYDLIQRSGESIRQAAIVIDVRERVFLDQFPEILERLRGSGAPMMLIFLECSDDVLKRRFSESRRPHPMMGTTATLEEAIRRERIALQPLRDIADRIIDTSQFTVHEIRTFLKNAFQTASTARGPNVHLVSFGFKYGVPAAADLVFDVRFLPNPFFVEALRPLPGTSPQVRSFLESKEETRAFVGRLEELMAFLLPLYAAEGKSYLTVSLGCTGGKHRSVALAEDLGERLGRLGVPVSVSHRDLGRE
jgi:RNase adapter protein RapZ